MCQVATKLTAFYLQEPYLLIKFRNLILEKFIKFMKLYFTLLMLKKEKIKLDQFKEFVFKS